MKRVLQDFVIDKIAAVDRPCQEFASVTIMKRKQDDVVKVDLNALADKISKGFYGSQPMTSPYPADTVDSAEDFNEALSEVIAINLDWKLESAVYDMLNPLMDALRKSIISICKDATLDPMSKILAIRNSVGQFLTAVQDQYPLIPQQINAYVDQLGATMAAKRAVLKLKMDILKVTTNSMLEIQEGKAGGTMPRRGPFSRNSQPMTKGGLELEGFSGSKKKPKSFNPITGPAPKK